jgi:2-polyprenyl-3-methyl-5-hydroxy-6-metoxy-1,4-benzoquinol methylase
MSAVRVSVVIPALGRRIDVRPTLDAVSSYFHGTGLDCELIVLSELEPTGIAGLPGSRWLAAERSYGTSLRKAIQDARGAILLIVDPELPYPASTLGDIVALIDSEATDVVFGEIDDKKPPRLVRWFLVPSVPDDRLLLKGFSAAAARPLFGEAKAIGDGLDLELAFLANKYGFRIERIRVRVAGSRQRSFRVSNLRLLDVIRIRLANRQMSYRAGRRCPICFSSEVWTHAQIPNNLIRICMRCKCRYVSRFWEEDEIARAAGRMQPVQESEVARRRTGERRMASLRRDLPAQARLLEIGAGDGSFGVIAGREFEYVGIDASSGAARQARSRGLEVYGAALSSFVNTGSSFDGVAIFRGFESFADPHDALARIKELLKPGGLLMVSTIDTEGLLYLMTERKLLPEHFARCRILFSRSAMIELLEHSGFEIVTVSGDAVYHDRSSVESALKRLFPRLGRIFAAIHWMLPDPLLVPEGTIRIIARRRVGPAINVRAIRAIEPTHAR